MEGEPAAAPKPFRLLDLPAELRLRIYEHALTAPDRAIRIYYSYQRDRINPGLALPLLRTCRQVHAEARDILYQENTVFVRADCHLSASPVIGSSHLPPPALARLRTCFVVLDTTDSSFFATSISHHYRHPRADFRPFQAMRRLHRLRLAVVTVIQQQQRQQQNEDDADPADASTSSTSTSGLTDLLSHVIERVPPRCALEYGAGTDPESAFVALYCRSYREGVRIGEVPAERLMRAAAYCQAEQGCKSGSDADWRSAGYYDDVFAVGTFEEEEDVRTW